MTASLLKPLLLVTAVLILPVVYMAVWGESFTGSLQRWQEAPPAPAVLFAAVVAILVSDVVLPVPSGPVATLAGSQLGATQGTLAAWCGMSLGAIIAFALARKWGRPLAERLSGKEQFQEAEQTCQRHGAWLLLLARPLPILAEASALVVGALQLPWRSFLPPVLLSNAVLAAIYAALGSWASERGWLGAAVCASAAAPLAVGAFLSRRWSKKSPPENAQQ
ncbi:MAG: VTT domain-containing protein [Planctomycetales bacterium]|nr:VTT domain-containing protein [Planctomycetales bacterium]